MTLPVDGAVAARATSDRLGSKPAASDARAVRARAARLEQLGSGAAPIAVRERRSDNRDRHAQPRARQLAAAAGSTRPAERDDANAVRGGASLATPSTVFPLQRLLRRCGPRR